MSAYVLADDTEKDLDEIWEFISVDRVDAADRWIDRLFSALEDLAQTPGMVTRGRI